MTDEQLERQRERRGASLSLILSLLQFVKLVIIVLGGVFEKLEELVTQLVSADTSAAETSGDASARVHSSVLLDAQTPSVVCADAGAELPCWMQYSWAGAEVREMWSCPGHRLKTDRLPLVQRAASPFSLVAMRVLSFGPVLVSSLGPVPTSLGNGPSSMCGAGSPAWSGGLSSSPVIGVVSMNSGRS
ncbi:hypothetical protein R1sor_026697 [Riccia sorocarpa]|uniref:Uncharacterized protein n=1 Tax=Riccia sorocarpa TaxID=122646 RepID=A0ABD3GG83_9MARC